MKRLFSITLLLLITAALGACGFDETQKNNSESGDTVTYESEFGDVEIPENPQRIAALTYGPNLHSLGVDMAGVDQWSKNNPLFEEDLSDTHSNHRS